MSIWDSITAPFTGAPIENAARAREAAIRAGQQQLGENYGAGRGALTEQFGLGREALTSQYGAGQGQLTDRYTQALQPYLQLQGLGQGGYGAYADISGAAGRAGQDRARAMFQTDPGYEFSINQQIDAMNRAANARGVAVGNSTSDIGNMVAGRAAQQWGDYANRLLPWLGQGQQTAAGLANIQTGLGTQLNQSSMGLGNALGANYTGLGGALNQSYTGQGDAAMRAALGIGEAQAQGAMAPMAAGQNIWNAGLNLANLGMGAFGRGGMFGQGGAFGQPQNPYNQSSSPLMS